MPGLRLRALAPPGIGSRCALMLISMLNAPDLSFCTAAPDKEHALGAAHPAWRRLWQIVRRTEDGESVAVLLWGFPRHRCGPARRARLRDEP